MVGLRGFLVGVLVLVISVSLSDLGTSIGRNQGAVKALEKPCQVKGLHRNRLHVLLGILKRLAEPFHGELQRNLIGREFQHHRRATASVGSRVIGHNLRRAAILRESLQELANSAIAVEVDINTERLHHRLPLLDHELSIGEN